MLNHVKQKMKKRSSDYLLLTMLGIVFLLLLVIFGVRYNFPDSTTYINMSPEIPPIYPILIWVFRLIFPDTIYLTMVALFQNMIAAYCIWNFTMYVKKEFQLNNGLTYFTSLILFVPFIATGVFTISKMIITNSILTEGLTVSLFLMLARYCLEVVITYERKPLLKALGLNFILILIRSQMIIPAIILLLVTIYWLIKTHKFKKGIIVVLLIFIAFLSIVSSTNKIYQKYLSSEKNVNTLNSVTVLTNVLYASDKEDVRLFKDQDMQTIYLRMFEIMEETKLYYGYSEPGILNRATHIEDAHDRLKQEIVYRVLNEYLTEHNIMGDTERSQIMLEIISKMTKILFLDNFGQWTNNYFCSAIQGLIRTNSIVAPIFTQFSMVMYVLAIGLMIWCHKKNARSKAALFMGLVLWMIFINAFGVATTIMCLSRYMIYNMAIFYVAILMLLNEVFQKKDNKVNLNVNS